MPQFNDHFIQAHRGASGAFPENTMRALVEAAAAGVGVSLCVLSDHGVVARVVVRGMATCSLQAGEACASLGQQCE